MQIPMLALFAVLTVSVCAEEKIETSSDTIRTDGGVAVKFELVKIPAGKIAIKDAKGKETTHEIKSIWMGRYEVTWAEYDVWWQLTDLNHQDRQEARRNRPDALSRPSQPYMPPDRGWGRDGYPAGSMSFQDAQWYVAWLSKMTGRKYRLPTEAEWEYACRAGGLPVKPAKGELEKMAWFVANSEVIDRIGDKELQTHPVGKKAPNDWGLHDMLGNVAEWVTMGDGRGAVAGGSFQDELADVNSSAREPYNPLWQKRDCQVPPSRHWYTDGAHIGIRVVREVDEEKDKKPEMKRVKVDLPQGGFEMEMVRLPDGQVETTDKEARRIDQPIKGIWIGKYELKYGQYNPFWQLLDLPEREGSKKFDAKSRPSKPYRLQYFESDEYPACGVSLLGAQKYCEWLSAQTGKKFRLPTEAEWEYACRAGEKPQPLDEKKVGEFAWYEKNSEDVPHETGKLMPNAWGIYDMQGNVAEWVSVGEEHAVKGGSFADGAAADLSPSIRQRYSKLWQRDDPKEPKSTWWLSNGGFVGFRVVMEE